MTKTLAVFLDLTPEQACAQWQRILRREWPGPGKRQESMHEDPRADHYFGDGSLATALIVPAGGFPPERRYLDYHREHVFEQREVG
jgi:hypothetical protein